MSRVAKDPIVLPSGVEATLSGDELRVKGAKVYLQGESARNAAHLNTTVE